MTNRFATSREDIDRYSPAESINHELRQFRRLQYLSDDEIAHRMAKSAAEVRSLRLRFGSAKVKLINIGLPYHLRVILGAARVRTLGDVQAKTDEEILALPTIGRGRLGQIRGAVKSFLESVYGQFH